MRAVRQGPRHVTGAPAAVGGFLARRESRVDSVRHGKIRLTHGGLGTRTLRWHGCERTPTTSVVAASDRLDRPFLRREPGRYVPHCPTGHNTMEHPPLLATNGRVGGRSPRHFVAPAELSRVQVTAHRGFGDRHPENTVAAAHVAARQSDVVEVDVRRSGSGDLVASHFGRLRWVTDATGRIAERSTDALARLNVQGSSWGIPRLDEVLAVIPGHVGIELDLKTDGLAADALTAAATVDNRVVVSAFDAEILRAVPAVDSSVPRAYDVDVRLDENLATAHRLGCERVNVHWAVCLATDVVDRARTRGLAVHAWPVGSRIVAWALGRRGVDGVIATTPEVAAWARRGHRSRSVSSGNHRPPTH